MKEHLTILSRWSRMDASCHPGSEMQTVRRTGEEGPAVPERAGMTPEMRRRHGGRREEPILSAKPRTPHAAHLSAELEVTVSDAGNGKVVVNRAMSLDGFIAGPGDSMDWGPTLVPPDDVAAIAAETGAMLVGRRTWDVGDKMEAEDPGSTDYPFSGSMFLLSHRPLNPPNPGVTVLSGDVGDAVAAALDSAGGKNLEILGANVAAQCFQRGLEKAKTNGQETRPSSGSASAGSAICPAMERNMLVAF